MCSRLHTRLEKNGFVFYLGARKRERVGMDKYFEFRYNYTMLLDTPKCSPQDGNPEYIMPCAKGMFTRKKKKMTIDTRNSNGYRYGISNRLVTLWFIQL